MVERSVFWHDRCVYNVIEGSGVLNALFVNSDGVGRKVDDVKRSCAARKNIVVYTSAELVCIFILGSDRWRSIKDDIFTRFINWSFVYTAIKIVFVVLFSLPRKSIYFFFAMCGCRLYSVHRKLTRMFRHRR